MVQKTTEKDPLDNGALSVPSKSTNDVWKWTKKKRRAVKLIVRGWSIVRVAKELEVHRHTVRRWKETREFTAAVLTEANEYTQRTRFKRVHEAGIFADQFSTQLAKTFTRMNKQDQGPSQLQLNALQTLTRGYSDFREQERADFGDNVKRFEGSFTIGALGAVDPATGAAGAQSFKSFVEENMDKIPKGLIDSARNPGEALILATRVLVQETDILDQLYEEDKVLTDKAKASK